MPTPSSGPISFLNLKNAFGTTNPVPINDFYRGGANVPDIVPNADIATTGQTSMDDYYSAWANKTLSFTVTVGSVASPTPKKGTLFGYGGGFGTINSDSFLTPGGTMIIQAMYFDTGTNHWHLKIGSTQEPADNNLTFKRLSVTGYTFDGTRVGGVTVASGNSRFWKWSSSSAHPTSGTVICSINYYG